MEPHALDADLPAWLKDSKPEELPASSVDSDLPSWLGSMPSLEGEQLRETLPEAAEELPATAGLPEEPLIPSSEPRPAASEQTFIPKPPFITPEPIPLGKMDPIFTEVPDWLTAATPQPAEDTAEEAPAGEEAPAITPGALPSWVQAMRPVEAARPVPGKTGELTLETKGALAGLQGVLPSTPYSGPSSKPKAISVKLQASEEQLNHANLLEQILLAETRPEPMIVQPRVVTQRALKIGIAVVLFLVILAAVFGGSSIFPMPVGWPREVQGALTAVEAIPPGSPVLVVFDYEPSLAGEMEAVAAPLLDHLIIRSHPRLTILSTSPTGSSLAERLLQGPLRDLQYSDYTNLGYLAGGLGGVRGFAQDPLASMPLAADASPAWIVGSTQGIQRLSDYTAIIVIVDRADAGRTWIEQTRDLHGSSSFIVVASAQAGPMIQPYYESSQINGLVTGLFDAAVVEQSNAGRPGLARKYWDAYNLALMLAILLVGFGSLWSLVAGLRERASGGGGLA
jgi:hypothetical protein